MRKWMRSTALAVLFAGVIPFEAPDIFVYKSAQADPADNVKIPSWVQSSCCGPSDVHRLRPDQVQRTDEGFYRVEGYTRDIPPSEAQPSQDGDYWIFYAQYEGYPAGAQNGQSRAYCFFVPMNF